MEKKLELFHYPFYTIGQRKIGVSLGPNPTYVIGINPEDNTVIYVGEGNLHPGLYRKALRVSLDLSRI